MRIITIILILLVFHGYSYAGDITSHFSAHEFDCPCCGVNNVDISLVEALEELREYLGFSVYVTSGYRCNNYGAKVGGVKRSQHLFGRGADIQVRTDLLTNTDLHESCLELGVFKYVKRYPNHVHVDTRR